MGEKKDLILSQLCAAMHSFYTAANSTFCCSCTAIYLGSILGSLKKPFKLLSFTSVCLKDCQGGGYNCIQNFPMEIRNHSINTYP